MKIVKKVSVSVWLLLGIVLANTSCQKDHVYDPTKVNHSSELEVPENFDWSTTRQVEFSLRADVPTVAKIYSDKACSSDCLMASLPVSATAASLQLEVGADTREVYLQYPSHQGMKVMTVALPQVSTKAGTVVKLPEDAVQPTNPPSSYKGLWTIAHKWTLMFEDNWPQKGDYDFNDFVVDYMISTDYTVGADEGNEEVYDKEGVTVKVRFRALGGIYAYRLGLQLDGTLAKHIDRTDLPKTENGITVSLQNPGADESAIFIFEGLEALKGRNGAKYFNTESGYKVDEKDLPEISFRLDIRSQGSLPKARSLTAASCTMNHNFFLQLKENGGREIHLRGYEPTKFYTNYEEDAQDLMNPEVKYGSKDNFVWGIKVPHGIPHVIEKVDIKDAYEDFAGWVVSGGKENSNWYKFPNLSNLMQ